MAWAKFIDANSIVLFDGPIYLCVIAAGGIEHQPLISGGGPGRVEASDLGWVNTAIGNINNALHGIYLPASAKELRKVCCRRSKCRSDDRTDAQREDTYEHGTTGRNLYAAVDADGALAVQHAVEPGVP